jgi:hypothetical protein
MATKWGVRNEAIMGTVETHKFKTYAWRALVGGYAPVKEQEGDDAVKYIPILCPYISINWAQNHYQDKTYQHQLSTVLGSLLIIFHLMPSVYNFSGVSL